MLDVNGFIIKEGDILHGKFFGMGGWWYQYAIVRDSPNLGLILETEGHHISLFDHPKFSSPERRKIVGKLPDKWNEAYSDKPCKYCNPKP